MSYQFYIIAKPAPTCPTSWWTCIAGPFAIRPQAAEAEEAYQQRSVNHTRIVSRTALTRAYSYPVGPAGDERIAQEIAQAQTQEAT